MKTSLSVKTCTPANVPAECFIRPRPGVTCEGSASPFPGSSGERPCQKQQGHFLKRIIPRRQPQGMNGRAMARRVIRRIMSADQS